MPVTQLQDQGGIGQAIGMVGGYLLGNPARKAKQAQQDIENQRNAASDKRADAAAIDTHNRITSEIAKNTSDTANTTADRTNKDFQQGAYAKLSGMLNSPPPQGTTAQQWVTHIQSQVPTLGLTDPKLLTQLYGEAQGVLAKDQTTQNAAFAGGEMALPSDPSKRLSVLMKRLQIEKSKPGFDTKPTEAAITDTQKQITEAQTAAHQNAVETRQSHHDQVMEGQGAQRIGIEQQNANRPREGDNPNSTANQRFSWDRHVFNMTHNADGTTKGTGKTAEEKPRALSVADSAAIDREARVALRDPNANPATIAAGLSAKWGLPITQAQAFVPGSNQAPAAPAAHAVAPAPPVAALPPTKINPANGKTYYLHAGDGKYYLTP